MWRILVFYHPCGMVVPKLKREANGNLITVDSTIAKLNDACRKHFDILFPVLWTPKTFEPWCIREFLTICFTHFLSVHLKQGILLGLRISFKEKRTLCSLFWRWVTSESKGFWALLEVETCLVIFAPVPDIGLLSEAGSGKGMDGSTGTPLLECWEQDDFSNLPQVLP